MRFKNSLNLLMENFKHVYKLLLSKVVIGLVATALCCAFVLPELVDFWESAQMQTLLSKLKQFFKLIFTADFSAVNEVKTEIFGKGGALRQVTKLLSTMVLEITLTVLGCVLVYLLKRFAETVCHFTVGSSLNDKMATYAESGFFTTFVARLGKASSYSLVYVPLIFLFDVVMIALVWLLLSLLPFLVAVFLSITSIVLLQALKLTVTGGWMPAMTTDGRTMRAAMRSTKDSRKQRLKVYSTYLVSVYLIIVVNILGALCTLGSALLITVPASYFFLICLQYVNYYTVQGKKYFLTYEKIAQNPDHGDSEHFFEYLAEEGKEAGENAEQSAQENKD